MVPKGWGNRGMSQESSDDVVDGTNFSFGLAILRRANVEGDVEDEAGVVSGYNVPVLSHRMMGIRVRTRVYLSCESYEKWRPYPYTNCCQEGVETLCTLFVQCRWVESCALLLCKKMRDGTPRYMQSCWIGVVLDSETRDMAIWAWGWCPEMRLLWGPLWRSPLSHARSHGHGPLKVRLHDQAFELKGRSLDQRSQQHVGQWGWKCVKLGGFSGLVGFVCGNK
ncbi:hypothetical protein E3N88_19853 [Mikania micrantha]|uniref:Uncharacterized protein n=1 Tax=Mikania micrantha TaxID=192012 RepID=A0A5N6NSI0_9ASTR|nr:hypothetical protein E3N88_19853 [Mikania micrantha]